MNANMTDITLVVDRSGSMDSVREDAEGGINAFIRQQAAESGDALLTLLQFDTEYELVHSGVPVIDVGDYTLIPRGMTALLDAVGRAIQETGQRLSRVAEEQRPGLVIFVVMTDGLENSSREFTRDRIRDMIRHQQERYSWQFTFLGADQDAFAEGRQLGIETGGIAHFSKRKILQTCGALGDKISRMRGQHMAGTTVSNSFTAEERRAMED